MSPKTSGFPGVDRHPTNTAFRLKSDFSYEHGTDIAVPKYSPMLIRSAYTMPTSDWAMAKSSEDFTASRIAAMNCEVGRSQSIYWDGRTPGLGLRVTSGAKSYIFESRLHGRTVR